MLNEAAVAERDAFTDFVAEVNATDAELDAMIVTAEGETRAQLKEAFDKVCDSGDWKLPWTAKVHHCYVGRVLRAVEFFHADEAQVVGAESVTGLVKMMGDGYQA